VPPQCGQQGGSASDVSTPDSAAATLATSNKRRYTANRACLRTSRFSNKRGDRPVTVTKRGDRPVTVTKRG